MAADLFDSIQLGDLMLANRMVMAPMTRNRADASGVATPMMATHYQQRASAGLFITESSPVSPQAIGYPFRRDCIPMLTLKAGGVSPMQCMEKGGTSLSSSNTVAGYHTPIFSRAMVRPLARLPSNPKARL